MQVTLTDDDSMRDIGGPWRCETVLVPSERGADGRRTGRDDGHDEHADGLTSPNYRYQWVRVDGSRHGIDACGDIGGRQEAEVQVTLTDDDSNTELEVETVLVVQRGADVGGPDGDDGRGHVLHVRVGDFAFADTDGMTC